MSKTDPTLAGKLQRAPTYQAALLGQWHQPLNGTPAAKAILLREAARADGIDIPSGYAFDPKKGFYDANADHWYSDPRVLGPIAVGAAGGIGAIATAPAAVTPAVTAPAAVGGGLPATSVPLATAIHTAAPAIAATGTTVAATGAGMNGLTQALLFGGQTIAEIFKSKAQSGAADKAVDAQVAAANKALDLHGRIYDTTRADLSPWTTRGTEAVNTLGARLNGGGGRQVASSMGAGTLGSVMPGQLATIQAPNGQTKQVPVAEVAHWESRGAKRVA